RKLSANASVPTAPYIAVGMPRRAAAIAWFKPFPPGRNETVAPRSVSPLAGRRSLCTTMSMLRLPQTATPLMQGSFHPGRDRQIFLAQEVGVEELGLITLATVGQDGDDGLAGPKIARQSNCAYDVDGRRAAKHQPLMHHEIEQDGQRVLVGDLVGGVDRRA